jgi:hypothetical protein
MPGEFIRGLSVTGQAELPFLGFRQRKRLAGMRVMTGRAFDLDVGVQAFCEAQRGRRPLEHGESGVEDVGSEDPRFGHPTDGMGLSDTRSNEAAFQCPELGVHAEFGLETPGLGGVVAPETTLGNGSNLCHRSREEAELAIPSLQDMGALIHRRGQVGGMAEHTPVALSQPGGCPVGRVLAGQGNGAASHKENHDRTGPLHQ